MNWQKHGYVSPLIWATLLVSTVGALIAQRWEMAFVAAATLAASLLPAVLAARVAIRLPLPFLSFAVLFIFATLFLGEAWNFYERFWWWDMLLHGTSAVGFGLVGFLFMFYLFEGNKYAAPPWAVAFFGWCFAVSIGTVWEIFEFAMDQTFGTNMQKSGLMDTMSDLIVDVLGAGLGGLSGFLYLKGQEKGGLLAWVIADFVRKNRRLFRRKRRDRG
jgi:uncharacterized membrane protein YjdF